MSSCDCVTSNATSFVGTRFFKQIQIQNSRAIIYLNTFLSSVNAEGLNTEVSVENIFWRNGDAAAVRMVQQFNRKRQYINHLIIYSRGFIDSAFVHHVV